MSSGDTDRAETVPSGDDRDRTAEGRDQRAEAHDQESEARDGRADARDHRAEVRDVEAAVDRAGAMQDRAGGAGDRTQAAGDREAASTDRAFSAQDRAASSIDGLTGAHRRDAGVLELEREVARAIREKHSLVLAFIDVDNLKAMNDSFGHGAGDRLLRRAADSIRANVRSYDLLIRYGGDEFLCALPDLSLADAAERFSRTNADMAAAEQAASVTVGLAELAAGDTLADLIARADEALYAAKAKSGN